MFKVVTMRTCIRKNHQPIAQISRLESFKNSEFLKSKISVLFKPSHNPRGDSLALLGRMKQPKSLK